MRRHHREHHLNPPKVMALAIGFVKPCRECGAPPRIYVNGACWCAEHALLGVVEGTRLEAEAVGAPPSVVNAAMDDARAMFATEVEPKL